MANLLTVNDLLSECELALPESPVATALSAAVATGSQTVQVGSIAGMYVGAQLIVGSGASQEIVALTALDPVAVTLTAVFAQTHNSGESVQGATFWAGQTANPLFTQTEMLAYLAETENDFLLRTRCLYFVGQMNVQVGVASYSQPADCIRLERIALGTIDPTLGFLGQDLYDEEQYTLDYMSDTSLNRTEAWYQDKLGNSMFGLGPAPPQVGGTLELIYSQKDTQALTLTSNLLVPDVMAYLVKWGVVARMFSKDGEIRDSTRAEYAQKRYQRGTMYVRRIMEGLLARLNEAEQVMEPALMGKK